MIEDKLKKVPEDHPNRCQAITGAGQCQYMAFYNEDKDRFERNCKMHGGAALAKNAERNYQFIKYQDRIAHFADSNQVKSLREEIAVLRMLLEETVNKCQNEVDLMIYSNKITDLAIKIEKLVVSCHRLESQLGQTLDKTAVLNIATRMVNIISEHVTDQKIIEAIVSSIGTMIQE